MWHLIFLNIAIKRSESRIVLEYLAPNDKVVNLKSHNVGIHEVLRCIGATEFLTMKFPPLVQIG